MASCFNIVYNCRDLGSSLRHLTVLWASRCGLQELDGISSMGALRELYLSYNELAEISPISMLEQIQILDLEGLVTSQLVCLYQLIYLDVLNICSTN